MMAISRQTRRYYIPGEIGFGTACDACLLFRL
jgi:hypothetical protein